MNDTTESLVKLAEDLTARVDNLERENEQLRAGCAQAKQAALRPVAAEGTVDATLGLLVKCGALDAGQITASRRRFLSDAEAPHRVLQYFLDAQLQAKTAAADNSAAELAGGRLAGAPPRRGTAQDACMDRMSRLLGLD